MSNSTLYIDGKPQGNLTSFERGVHNLQMYINGCDRADDEIIHLGPREKQKEPFKRYENPDYFNKV